MSRAAAIAACALAALLLVPSAFGVSRYAITGGSMGDALPKGSLAFTTTTTAGAARPGDVITFQPPGLSETVTHRVLHHEDGAIRTRGDANRAADPWRLDAAAHIERVRFHIPLAGYAVVALRGPLALALLALVLAAALLRPELSPSRKAATA